MTECPSEELMARYAAGACDVDASAMIRSHLARICPKCANWLAETQAGEAILPDVRAAMDVQAADASRGRLEHGRGASHVKLPADLIKGYELREELGRGGMAVVYLARQALPERDVAIKVMGTGTASRSGLRRFRFESQVLARLLHPNIAQVYEVGTVRLAPAEGTVEIDDDRSVPYFVMEYVPDADSIIKHADKLRLEIRARLELFLQVCDAVQHGHQKGVIHRDLKPSNILVGAEGRVKVIDFGVARSTDSDIAATTMQTDVGQIIGTLQYMSPEQCEADPHNLDTRTDVYSLGVVLYELLTRRLPYDVSRTSIYHATRTIREDSPIRPSAIDRRLRGDLETIVLKALEKEQDQRYQSADSLARDVRHYLGGELIEAQAPTLTRVVGRFVWRYRALCAALAGLFLVLSAGVVISSWLFVSRRHAIMEAMSNVYAARIAMAEAAIHAGDIGQASSNLDLARTQFLSGVSDAAMPWEWRHLHARLDQSVELLTRALGEPSSSVSTGQAAIDPTGSWLIGGDKPPRLANLATGEVWSLPNQDSGETGRFALSADGRFAATVTAPPDGTVRFWRTDQGRPEKPILQWRPPDAPSGIGWMAFHPGPETQYLACTYQHEDWRRIHIWRLRGLSDTLVDGPSVEPTQVCTLSGHERTVVCLAFSADGRLLASGSVDCSIRLWDFDQAVAGDANCDLACLRGHSDHVLALAFDKDSKRLASGSVDTTIRLWDVNASIERAKEDRKAGTSGSTAGVTTGILAGHGQVVTAVRFDPSGRWLASGGRDGVIRIWDTQEDASVPDVGHQQSWIVPVRRQANMLRGHTEFVLDLAFRKNGELVSCGNEIAARTWRIESEDVALLREHNSSVMSVTFDPKGRFLVSTGGDGSFMVWDPHSCAPLSRRTLLGDEIIYGAAILPSADRTILAIVTRQNEVAPNSGRVVLWDLEDPRNPQWLCDLPDDGSRTTFTSLAAPTDGSRLAASDTMGRIWIWDMPDARSPRFAGHLDLQRTCEPSLCFLDDRGRWLLSAEGYRHPYGQGWEEGVWAIRLWDVDHQTERASYRFHTKPVSDLAIAPDRSMVASGSADRMIALWSISWGSDGPALTFKSRLVGHTDVVRSVCFDGIGKRLFSGSIDRTIKVWDLETTAHVATLRGQAGFVSDLAFDASSERLASASQGFQGADNVVRLWETSIAPEARERRAAFKRLQDRVWELFKKPGMSPEGAREKILLDDTIPEDVRKEAVARFDVFLPHPAWFVMWANVTAMEQGLDAVAYERALVYARAAADMMPESGKARIIAGILLYRLELYEDALAALQEAREFCGGSLLVEYFSLLAMTQHRLGEASAATAALDEAESLERRPGESGTEAIADPEASACLEEARKLLGRESIGR